MQELEKEFKFKLRGKIDDSIAYLDFEDGRVYKFTQPSFMDIHEIKVSDNPEHNMFLTGVARLIPENDKSVRIDEAYCNQRANWKEAAMWSRITRRLLRLYFDGI